MTVTSDEVVTLGPYVVNDIPPPIVYTFYESDGATVVDLSEFTSSQVSFHWRRSRTTTEVERSSASIVGDGTAGQVEYAWVVADFATPGVYYARFDVDNGTNAYRSVLLVYEVKAFL